MTDMGPEEITAALQQMRESIEALAAQVGRLAEENRDLRERLEASQTARTDLVAQAEHLIHALGQSREEVRKLQS